MTRHTSDTRRTSGLAEAARAAKPELNTAMLQLSAPSNTVWSWLSTGTHIEGAALSSRKAGAEDAATTARPWPKEGFAQFTALRDVILSRDGLWPLAEISRAFKGARPEELAFLLDILSGQGVVVPVGEPRVGWRRG